MSPSSFPMKMALPCLTISVSETGSSGSRIKCPLPSLDGPRASLTSFDIPPLPAPLDAAWAILKCTGMLTWTEKLRLGWGLLPAYLQGQPYVESQESATVEEWMQQRSIPQSVVDEVFVAMSKALGFVGPERLSMHCVLIALSRFLQESTGSRIAVLDGSPTERLCEHLRDYIDAGGGEVRVNAAVERFLLNADDTVAGVLLADGSVVSGDAYVNARLVDALKKLTPGPWPYADDERSMLPLVLASAAKYRTKSDEEISAATLEELEQHFPKEVKTDGSLAKVNKFTCVRTPTSVDETTPGTEAARPTQKSPIANFFCAGGFSKQKYLASMEGAILSGKLAAKEVAEWSFATETKPRRLTERPPTRQVMPTPPMTMYVARLAPDIPSDVQAELGAPDKVAAV